MPRDSVKFEIDCEKSILLEAVKFASGFIPNRVTHPILICIKLTAEDDVLEIESTNLDQGCKIRIPCTSTKKGQIVLPGKQLSTLLANLVGDNVAIYLTEANQQEEKLTTNDYVAVISSGQQEASLVVQDANEYPDIDYKNPQSLVEIDAKLFSAGIQKTVHCTSTDLSKMVLCGINIASTSQGLTFTATNGHCMALATIPGAFNQQINLTVPGLFLGKVQKLLKDADTLAFSIKNNSLMTQLTTTLGKGNVVDISLYSRLLDGTFPDCARLIPPDFNRKVLFSREQLLQALGLIGSCDSESERTAYTCSFEVQAEQTKITKSGSSVLNVCQLTNSTIVEGDPIIIGFNYDYLKKHLTALSSAEVSLKMNGEKSPVIVHGDDEDVSTTLLIMPVQLVQ